MKSCKTNNSHASVAASSIEGFWDNYETQTTRTPKVAHNFRRAEVFNDVFNLVEPV